MDLMLINDGDINEFILTLSCSSIMKNVDAVADVATER